MKIKNKIYNYRVPGSGIWGGVVSEVWGVAGFRIRCVRGVLGLRGLWLGFHVWWFGVPGLGAGVLGLGSDVNGDTILESNMNRKK